MGHGLSGRGAARGTRELSATHAHYRPSTDARTRPWERRIGQLGARNQVTSARTSSSCRSRQVSSRLSRSSVELSAVRPDTPSSSLFLFDPLEISCAANYASAAPPSLRTSHSDPRTVTYGRALTRCVHFAHHTSLISLILLIFMHVRHRPVF